MNLRGDAPIRAHGGGEFCRRSKKQKVSAKFLVFDGQFRKALQEKKLGSELTRGAWKGRTEFAERNRPRQRNICKGWFVYTSAAGNEAVPGEPESQEIRNPAVAAAGRRHASLSGR